MRMPVYLLVIFLLLSSCSKQVNRDMVFPGKTWQVIEHPENSGWSPEKMTAAENYAKEIHSKSFMVVDNGLIAEEFGNASERIIVQSVRKSFLNALYGIAISKRKIDITRTLGDLKIDDMPPLTEEEKSATVEQLLMSKSGVYHASASSTEFMRDHLPERGSHQPGTYWYYNNWDFNVLGTIFEKESGDSIFESFNQEIAKPLMMEDFSVAHCYYQNDSGSIHPAYHFSMSPRDMARFGLLYLNNGVWNNDTIIPERWIRKSTQPYSGNKYQGYGYLWWIDPKTGDYSARGGSGQLILISPEKKLVIVHTVDRLSDDAPSWDEVYKLVDLIKEAKN